MLKSKILNQVQDLIQHDVFHHFAIATQSLEGDGVGGGIWILAIIISKNLI